MKTQKPNAVHVSKFPEVDAKALWIQLEDEVVPQLRLSLVERVVYANLLRHTRLQGQTRLRFSIPWLARNLALSGGATRNAVRRLVARGVLRLLERSCKAHHVVHVRLPEEIPAFRHARIEPAGHARLPRTGDLEEIDFLQTKPLRRSIHARERGLCFYCLRQLPVRARCLDHVVPRARSGRNSYRNLVSCCLECNSLKAERSAPEFFQDLYRRRRLTSAELDGRLRALDDLAAGKLRPVLANPPRLAPLKVNTPFATAPRKTERPS